VAAYSALEGDNVEVSLAGVYALPKIAGAIELGEPLYWNGAALTTVASGLPRVGVAAKAAGADDPTVQVRLSGETA
jgi:predicted RecA/RadA family phage recombinase